MGNNITFDLFTHHFEELRDNERDFSLSNIYGTEKREEIEVRSRFLSEDECEYCF